jgi:hypothetical protein
MLRVRELIIELKTQLCNHIKDLEQNENGIQQNFHK